MVIRPAREALVCSFEGKEDPPQVIPRDPGKPALSLDSFRFENFPEGTFDSQLCRDMTIVGGGEYASLVGQVDMDGVGLVKNTDNEGLIAR